MTTVEMVSSAVGVRLYNTRALRRYTSAAEIARLIDALAPHGLQVEAWIPKASVDGRIADLRFLVIAGEPAFRVLRKSRHPITNLHLGGERADPMHRCRACPLKAVEALRRAKSADRCRRRRESPHTRPKRGQMPPAADPSCAGSPGRPDQGYAYG